MGKKSLQKIVPSKDESNESLDPELEAELAAIMEIRKEQQKSSSEPNLTSVSNKDSLRRCVESLTQNPLPFIETYQISHFDFDAPPENDDLEREMAFYNHTLEAVKFGKTELKELGVPVNRPADYFCEHLKSDSHVGKIKDRLLLEDKKMEAFEQRKQREYNRKYQKQLAEIKKKESKESSDEKGGAPGKKRGRFNEKVAATKKYGTGDKSDDNEMGGGGGGGKSSTGFKDRGGRDRGLEGGKSKKRKIMDKKYGFGAKDKMRAKKNDHKSINDFSEYNPRGGKQFRASNGMGGGGSRNAAKRNGKAGGSGGGKGGNRPGKATRDKKRTGK